MFKISELELLYARVYDITDLRKYNFGKVFAERFGNMTLGEMLLKTNNLKTHKKLHGIGDKTFSWLCEAIKNSKEYQSIQIEESLKKGGKEND